MLQMWTTRLRRSKWYAQGHSAMKQQSQDSNPGLQILPGHSTVQSTVRTPFVQKQVRQMAFLRPPKPATVWGDREGRLHSRERWHLSWLCRIRTFQGKEGREGILGGGNNTSKQRHGGWQNGLCLAYSKEPSSAGVWEVGGEQHEISGTGRRGPGEECELGTEGLSSGGAVLRLTMSCVGGRLTHKGPERPVPLPGLLFFRQTQHKEWD